MYTLTKNGEWDYYECEKIAKDYALNTMWKNSETCEEFYNKINNFFLEDFINEDEFVLYTKEDFEEYWLSKIAELYGCLDEFYNDLSIAWEIICERNHKSKYVNWSGFIKLGKEEI